MTSNDARADLAYIRQLMEDTRRAAYVSGGYFIVWGIAISAGLLLTWLMVRGLVPSHGMLAWTVCLAAGGVGTFFLIQREKREPVQTPAGRLIGMVWMSLGISMLIIFFIGVGSGTLNGALMSPLSAAMVGNAVFLTGVLAGMPWLRNLAVGWWAGAAAMFGWPGLWWLPLMGAMLLAFYVVPGVILVRARRRARSAGRV